MEANSPNACLYLSMRFWKKILSLPTMKKEMNMIWPNFRLIIRFYSTTFLSILKLQINSLHFANTHNSSVNISISVMLYHSVGKKLYSLCFLFYCHHRLEIKFLLTYLLTYLSQWLRLPTWPTVLISIQCFSGGSLVSSSAKILYLWADST